jgi:hypothetical protein
MMCLIYGQFPSADDEWAVVRDDEASVPDSTCVKGPGLRNDVREDEESLAGETSASDYNSNIGTCVDRYYSDELARGEDCTTICGRVRDLHGR